MEVGPPHISTGDVGKGTKYPRVINATPSVVKRNKVP